MMSIQGIGQYNGLYQSYKAPSIPNIKIDDVSKQQNTNQDFPNISSIQTDQSANLSQQSNNVSRQSFDLQDISLVFNKNDNFDYIGNSIPSNLTINEIIIYNINRYINPVLLKKILSQYCTPCKRKILNK